MHITIEIHIYARLYVLKIHMKFPRVEATIMKITTLTCILNVYKNMKRMRQHIYYYNVLEQYCYSLFFFIIRDLYHSLDT